MIAHKLVIQTLIYVKSDTTIFIAHTHILDGYNWKIQVEISNITYN